MRLTLSALPNNLDMHFSGSVNISQSRYSIGRGDNNDWVLVDTKKVISKRHCTIEQTDGGYRLVDSSTNGTAVNGKAVDKNVGHILQQGDEIELGHYRFRVTQLEKPSHRGMDFAVGDDPFKPKITSILHDVASAGVGGNSVLPGDEGDIFSNRTGVRTKGQDSIASALGWDGPPPSQAEVVKPASPLPANREFADKMEQSPVNRMVIDMPKPAAIIPDNWFQDDVSATIQSPATVQKVDPILERRTVKPSSLDVGTFQIVPVENIELNVPTVDAAPDLALVTRWENKPADDTNQTFPAATSPLNQGRSSDLALVQSFCTGLGIAQSDLENVDLPRFFQNVGKAIALSASGLQNVHIAKNKALSRLDVSGGRAGQTPWIFSLGGEDREKVVHSVIQFLTEAESVDLELMRRDYVDIEDVLEGLSISVINFIENMQDRLSETELEKNVSSASKALSSLRKAALWEAYVEKSGFYDKASKQKLKANILPLFMAELSKQKKR
jgi:type VI secretion system protein